MLYLPAHNLFQKYNLLQEVTRGGVLQKLNKSNLLSHQCLLVVPELCYTVVDLHLAHPAHDHDHVLQSLIFKINKKSF